MAVPGISEVATMTLRKRMKKLANNVSRNNAVLTRLNSRGNKQTFSGGRNITVELEYANNQTYQRYSGYQLLNIAPSQVFSAAEYAIRQVAVAVSISGLEELQNSGEGMSINLLRSRIKNAERSYQNGFSYDIYSDGSITGQIGGLASLVSTSPATGVVGGIDRATWGFWRNYAFSASTDGGAALSSANVSRYMRTIWSNIVRGADRPDLILADNDAWGAYYDSLHAIQRITNTESDVGKAGFSNLKFIDCDVVMDGGYQGSTLDGNNFGAAGAAVVGGVNTSNMIFLNTDFLYLMSHQDRDMVPLDPNRYSVNQDAMVKIIGWAGNICLANAFLQGRLYA